MSEPLVKDRLFDVCGSVCCSRTPALEPSKCGAGLLMKYDSREKVLVQLSAIRCLYCSLSPAKLDLDRSDGADFKTFSLEVVDFFSHHSQSLYRLLVGYMESSDQFISFTASKALVYVMLHSGVQTHVVEDIFIKLQAHIDTQGAVYCLQTIREFLKISRKNPKPTNQTKVRKDTDECLKIISCNDYWKSTLQLFLNIGSTETGTSKNRGLRQSLAEFLSLTTEILRHKSDESSTTSSIGCLQQCIASSVSAVLSLVGRFASVFVLKKFINALLKVEQVCAVEETCYVAGIHSVAQVLRELFRLRLVHSILCVWRERHAERLQLTLFPRPNLAKDGSSQSEIELVDISVRKTILLVLNSVASLLRLRQSSLLQSHKPHSNDSASAVIDDELNGVLSSLSALLSSCVALDHSSNQHYCKVLYSLVSEEDACLVSSLRASTAIHRLTTQNPAILECVPRLETFVAVTNTHSLWLNFLVKTGFDHSMLLDLILTPEIDFSSTLTDFLTLVCDDWSGFVKTASGSQITLLRGSPMEDSECREDTSSIDEGTMEHSPPWSAEETTTALTHTPSLLATLHKDYLKLNTTVTVKGSLVDYSSSSEEEEAVTHTNPTSSPHKTTEHVQLRVPSVHPSNVLTSNVAQDINARCAALSTDPPSTPLNLSSSSSSSSSSSVLEEMMGCLIRLRLSLERLGESGLVPHYHTSLVTAISKIEELYEKS